MNPKKQPDTSLLSSNIQIVDGMKALAPKPYGPKVRRKTENDARMKAKQKIKRCKRNKMARRSRAINRRK